jgi:PhzF family phenazine biosynthesis protein
MASEIRIYQIDAFTDRPFAGNPAAVCPLDSWLADPLMQAIAAENNLSETAFLVPRDDGFRLRWFTPTREVDLCGHATLASAFVVMNELEPGRNQVTFDSRGGLLTVARQGDRFVMDFPSFPLFPIAAPASLDAAIGATPGTVLAARDVIAVVLDDAETVRRLRPNLAAMAMLDAGAVMVTARGTGADSDVDFVSRFFAPRFGIPEDPVTGSAHCSLTPYWAHRLGRNRLHARQVSARGGNLGCELIDDRVAITGQAVLVLRGTMRIPG